MDPHPQHKTNDPLNDRKCHEFDKSRKYFFVYHRHVLSLPAKCNKTPPPRTMDPFHNFDKSVLVYTNHALGFLAIYLVIEK